MPVPPLSYSLPAFRAQEYDDAAQSLERLASLGFSWVTLTPTYPVRDTLLPGIERDRSLGIAPVERVVRQAQALGLQVKLEPHLDWAATLQGGPYEWRRRMYFAPCDPIVAYHTLVLEPYAALLRQPVAAALTLGSELDASWLAFADEPEGWRDALHAVRAGLDGAPVWINHKLNHDALERPSSLRETLHQERQRRGLPCLQRQEQQALQEGCLRYLAELDAVSFSFYPALHLDRPQAWWRQAANEPQVQEIAHAFRAPLRHLANQVRALQGPSFTIGEVGLGSTNSERPYHFEESTFLQADGTMDPGARELRRNYYLGFLRCLEQNGDCFASDPVTFWTVSQFDFLNATHPSRGARWHDPVLEEAVAAYNKTYNKQQEAI